MFGSARCRVQPAWKVASPAAIGTGLVTGNSPLAAMRSKNASDSSEIACSASAGRRWVPDPNFMSPMSAATSTSGIHIVIGSVALERPVVLVLVPRGVAAAGLLEQGLVVVQPHAVDAQQLGGDRREAGRERERSDRRILLPEVADLNEGLAVRVSLIEGALLDGVAERGLTDQRSVGGDLVGPGDAAQQHVPVTLEVTARIAAQRVGGIELGQRGGGPCHWCSQASCSMLSGS